MDDPKANPIVDRVVQKLKQLSQKCFGKSSLHDFILFDHPSIFLHILTSCNVDPDDLARLEETCSFFRNPANFSPDNGLSLPELAALDICQKRTMFKTMKNEERCSLKQKCGGSWKLVLKFLLAVERACPRREKSQVAAGYRHSVVVSSKGEVYSFGFNGSGQLGLGTLQSEPYPQLVSSLRGIRVVQVVAFGDKTLVVTDCGQVYAFGNLRFGEATDANQEPIITSTPQLVEPFQDIFTVQIAIAEFFIAALSRDGRVYTLYWGKENKLIHQTEPDDTEARPLDEALENIPVVQISAGYCYLLALAFQPSGMSIYSVGCGLGGKLGHGTVDHERKVKLVERLKTLNIEPTMIAAGTWSIVVMAKDGRVCSWGWGYYGCLGHGNEEQENPLPVVVDALSEVKAVHIATGNCTTFVVAEDGDVYSFGTDYSASLGHGDDVAEGQVRPNILLPKKVAFVNQADDRIVQISPTKSLRYEDHTLVLTESGKVYAFGQLKNGQLGVKIPAGKKFITKPELVDINLG